MAYTLKKLLAEVIEHKASDLHLNRGLAPQMRVDGSLMAMGKEVLGADDAQKLCYECLNQEQVMKLEADRSIDISFEMGGLSRFRANVYWSMDTIAGAFRVIPLVPPMPEQLGLPKCMIKITEKTRGLVLVTGPTGCGKSTTLASLIDHINRMRSDHIVTIEDPIEYVYTQHKSVINQREVGRDTLSFQRALKYILRQDPDVVLIGEMRDLETIQSAITVAETGHLVFATLHTNSAVQTVDRIIDVFPPHQQQQVRTQLSFILEGVFCQQLLPKIGGGRSLALEILLPHSGIRNMIRELKTHQVFAQMQMGQQQTGMVTMDQSLASLVRAKAVDKEEARRRCVNPDDFENYTRG